MKPTRLFIVLLVLGFGFWQGGLYGVFAMFIIFGCTAFIWFAIADLCSAIFTAIFMPRKLDVTVYDGGARKGHPDIEGTARHPDPTRPTTDDYMGLITYRLKKGE
jgi:hypothetical protein